MNFSKPALLLGDLLVDVMMPIAAYPPPGGDGLSNELILCPGGSVVNTACALVNLGAAARLLGRAGRDPWGDFEVDQLRLAGVDVSSVARDPATPTGLSFVPVVPGGERTLFSYRGANNSLSPDDIPAGMFPGAGLLHVSAYAFLNAPQCDAARRAMDLAREAGIPVSLDTGVAPIAEAPETMAEVVRAVDICVLGPEEARLLTGEAQPDAALRVLETWGPAWIALKLGSHGCWLAGKGQVVQVPGLPVDSIDTTGAGDAFCAGLIYARLAGLDLPAAGLLAGTLGALATTVWGAGPGLPGRDAVLGLLRRTLDDGGLAGWEAAAQGVFAALSA